MNIATGEPCSFGDAILLTECQLADHLDRIRSNQHPDSWTPCELTLMGYT